MQTDIKDISSREPLILRPGDDAWGPFGVNCEPHLPTGAVIDSVSATAYLDGTEVPDLIEPDSETTTGDTDIQIKFQATGDVAAGIYYVDIELTLVGGAVKHLAFGPVKVEGWS